ncbi:hypothetical protein Bint_1882 [Brachyspira intermedia PWS/A]|uniref:Lipoprotein n=1 Tax=Brachyspira intermedia (strain ATCC 51140 / PWS/A) TaxID=1045858 RepID=G0EK32_BRAIP|nr:hypothetical protein [Brachyspira intermedia]AEM22498.1 hypothetical protein Bint_1882 [Brachyspira intermedia PWS/A]
MIKNLINKNKKLYFILLLLILIIVLMISCKKINILGPNNIPPPTDFRLPEDTIPGHIDVNPMPAKNGEVFGSFQRKFKYQGKWYVLADYMYDYDPKTKTLNRKAEDIILQIDNNGNIVVYDKDSKGYRYLLRMNVIEENRVLYEDDYYGSYSYSSSSFTTTDCKGEEDYHTFSTGITFNNEIRTSSDLINWTTEGSRNNVYKAFPSVSTDPNASFQGRYGARGYKIVEFKDYIYLIGLEEDFREQNALDGCRNENQGPFTVSKNVYYRIDKNKDTSIGANWEKINTLWGQRSSLNVRYDKDKIYVTKGERSYWEWIGPPYWTPKEQSFENDSTIWSSTDGVTWNIERNSADYDNAEEISSYYDIAVGGNLPYIKNRIKTPEEPDWIKLDNGRYYKSDNSPYGTYTINNKTYYVPIPPYEEIRAAYDSGQEYFTITEEHIKSAGLNQFLTKDKEPNKDEDWTVITPIDYTDKLMVWQSGGEKVMLNINNKAVQLVDYRQIEAMYNSIKEYSIVINYLRKTAKELRDGTYWSDFANDYIKDVLLGMEYDARADMLELLKSNREYIMPDEAVTHYTVEFKY